MAQMSISLVLCTLGRVAELHRFADSLIRQHYQNLEIVVVDQSDGIAGMAEAVDRLKVAGQVQHIRHAKVGASAARNIGAAYTTGEIIGFPDDDCWYPTGVLSLVNELFTANPTYDGITGQGIISEDGTPDGRFLTTAEWVQRSNIWTTSIEFTVFLRREAWNRLGGFDEHFGPGANTPFGSGEGTEQMIRAVDLRLHVWYTPDLKVVHPWPPTDLAQCRKAYYYAIGMGYLARKYRLPVWQTVVLLARPFLVTGKRLLSGRPIEVRFSANISIGRCVGYIRGGSYERSS